MKRISVNLARSVWLFPTQDVNPKGVDFVPIWTAIKNRYQFFKFPSKPEELFPPAGSMNIKFESGAYRLEDGPQIEILNLAVYRDGIVAETRHSTDATDAFIRDVIAFVTKNQEIVFDEKMIRKKVYVSQLIVTSKVDLESASSKYRDFCALLSSTIDPDRPFQPIGIRFGTESTDALGPGSLFSNDRLARVSARIGITRKLQQKLRIMKNFLELGNVCSPPNIVPISCNQLC